MDGRNVSARRAASAIVRSLGATSTRIEMPSPPTAGDDGEQLGLETPQFQVRVLAPVAVRSTKVAMEVLVAAEVLEDLLGVSGPGAAIAAAKAVYAVVIEDVRYRFTDVESVQAMGGVCLYRLLLEPNRTEVV